MPNLSQFIAMITSENPLDLPAIQLTLDDLITEDGRCVVHDDQDLNALKAAFDDSVHESIAEEGDAVFWLARMVMGLSIMHSDGPHQLLLGIFLDALLKKESPDYVNVLELTKVALEGTFIHLKSAHLKRQLKWLDERFVSHSLTESHVKKLNPFNYDPLAYRRHFFTVLDPQAAVHPQFDVKSVVRDQAGRYTPFSSIVTGHPIFFNVFQYVDLLKRYLNTCPEGNLATAKLSILSEANHGAMRDALFANLKNRRVEEVIRWIECFQVLGVDFDVRRLPDVEVLLFYYHERSEGNLQGLSAILKTLNLSLDDFFDLYQALPAANRVAVVRDEYLTFLKDKKQWTPKAIFDHLTLAEKQSLTVMGLVNLALAAVIPLESLRLSLSASQVNELKLLFSSDINRSGFFEAHSELEMPVNHLNLVMARQLGVDLDCMLDSKNVPAVFDTMQEVDQATALILFRSKVLQDCFRAYPAPSRLLKKLTSMSYRSISRLICTALLALDPAIYNLPADQTLGLTSFKDALCHWMVLARYSSGTYSYQKTIFHDDFDRKGYDVPGDDGYIHVSDFRNYRDPSLCTSEALRKRVRSAKPSDTPASLRANEPNDEVQISAMLLLRKYDLNYDRHGVKHAMKKILDTYPEFRVAFYDRVIAAIGSDGASECLLGNILMSHRSDSRLKSDTKEFKAVIEGCKRQSLSPVGLTQLKECLDRQAPSGPLAMIYLLCHPEPSDEDVLRVTKEHFCDRPLYNSIMGELFGFFGSERIDWLRGRLLHCILKDIPLRESLKPSLKALFPRIISESGFNRADFKGPFLLAIFYVQKASFGGSKDLDANLKIKGHGDALLAHLLSDRSPEILLAKYGKFAQPVSPSHPMNGGVIPMKPLGPN